MEPETIFAYCFLMTGALYFVVAFVDFCHWLWFED